MSIPKCLDKYQDIVLQDMHNFLDGSDLEHIKMVYYHLGWLDADLKPVKLSSGKLSRPSILLLVNETLGGNVERALPAATAVQIFHDFTLMHDDIEDGDTLRRHRETAWKVWGVPRAINAGDAMYTLNFKSLLRLTDKRDEVLAYLLNVYGEIVAGQDMDLSFVSKNIENVSSDDYKRMIQGKSAELIGASAKVGAILAGSNGETQEKFYQYGNELGLAYQVFDDIVSFWGCKESSGKSECRDVIERKKTLPILMGFELSEEKDSARLTNIYKQREISVDDVAEVLAILAKYKVKEACLAKLEEHKNLASLAVENLGLENSSKQDFIDIIDWLIPGEVS